MQQNFEVRQQQPNSNNNESKPKMKKPVMLLVAAMAAALTMPANAEEAGALPGLAAQPPSYFYTGKPYDADLDAYVFLYRSYDPGSNRWTTSDPSGFPDGPNGRHYAPTPTYGLDRLGLFYSGTSYNDGTYNDVADRNTWTAGKFAAIIGLPMTADSMNHADGANGGTWTLAAWEIALVKRASEYRTFKSDIGSALTLAFGGAGDGSSSWSTDARHYEFNRNNDWDLG